MIKKIYMTHLEKIIGEIEIHNVDGIRECFENGLSPNAHYQGEPLIYELTSEYLRSPRFRDCVKTFVDYGLVFSDQVLLSVLLDDARALEMHVKSNPDIVTSRYSLRCAFTPLLEVTLLHVCAEFNQVSCAEVLL